MIVWKEYNRLYHEHLAALLAAGVPEDQARERARHQAREALLAGIAEQKHGAAS